MAEGASSGKRRKISVDMLALAVPDAATNGGRPSAAEDAQEVEKLGIKADREDIMELLALNNKELKEELGEARRETKARAARVNLLERKAMEAEQDITLTGSAPVGPNVALTHELAGLQGTITSLVDRHARTVNTTKRALKRDIEACNRQTAMLKQDIVEKSRALATLKSGQEMAQEAAQELIAEQEDEAVWDD